MAARNRQLIVFIKGEPYYSAQKAQDELGMTYSALRNQVTIGNIKSQIPPGKRQAHYRGKDVIRTASELRMLTGSSSYITGKFRPMTEDDLLECTKISDMIFGGHIDIARQKTWLTQNPEIGYIVESEGKIVGYLIIAPLQPEKIEKLLTEEESSITMDTHEIEAFTPGKPLHLYGIAIGVLPGLTLAEKRAYGAKLIGGFIDILVDWGKRGIVIDTIVARSTKPDGIRLLRNLGFTQVPSVTEKKNFVLKIETSGSREAMLYKQALQDSGIWKPEPFSFEDFADAHTTTSQAEASNIEIIQAQEEDVRKIEPISFTIATAADIPACIALNQQLFTASYSTDNTTLLNKWLKWIKKNPEIIYTLKRGEEVIGIATMLPFKPDSKKFRKALMDDISFLLGDVNISADDIEEYKTGNHVLLYIAEIGIKPNLEKDLRRKYGAKLISKFMDTIVDLGKRGIVIEEIISVGATRSGIRLLQHFGFSEIPFSRPDTRLFTINMKESGAPIIQAYREALSATNQEIKTV